MDELRQSVTDTRPPERGGHASSNWWRDASDASADTHSMVDPTRKPSANPCTTRSSPENLRVSLRPLGFETRLYPCVARFDRAYTLCHNRTFDGSGLAIVWHSLSNDKWAKPIRSCVAYGQAMYARASGLGFKRRF